MRGDPDQLQEDRDVSAMLPKRGVNCEQKELAVLLRYAPL
jgi:hypothetical protein